MEMMTDNALELVFGEKDIDGGVLRIPGNNRVFAVIDESSRQYPFVLDEVTYDEANTYVNLAAIMVYRNLTAIPGQWRIVFAGGDGDEEAAYRPDATGVLAERYRYDDEPKGFSFMDIETGVVYCKFSGESGDWTGGFSLRGEKGEAGEAGPAGPEGPTGPQGNITAVVAATAPVNPPDGMIWIEG